ncbi:unnamed protein product [Eretmochelys imbricata]
MKPISVEGPTHKTHRQYPIKPEALESVKIIVTNVESKGVIRKTTSTTNSPIWPIRKPDGTWRLTIDYTHLNQVTPKAHPIVASPATILNLLKPGHSVFSGFTVAAVLVCICKKKRSTCGTLETNTFI